jgi:hypothetical protein
MLIFRYLLFDSFYTSSKFPLSGVLIWISESENISGTAYVDVLDFNLISRKNIFATFRDPTS